MEHAKEALAKIAAAEPDNPFLTDATKPNDGSEPSPRPVPTGKLEHNMRVMNSVVRMIGKTVAYMDEAEETTTFIKPSIEARPNAGSYRQPAKPNAEILAKEKEFSEGQGDVESKPVEGSKDDKDEEASSKNGDVKE